LSGKPVIVGIEKCDPITLRMTAARIAGPSRAKVPRVADHPDPAVAFQPGWQREGLGRGIIDNYNFMHQLALGQRRPQCAFRSFLALVDRNDDADLHAKKLLIETEVLIARKAGKPKGDLAGGLTDVAATLLDTAQQ